jgi:hypothetical protein
MLFEEIISIYLDNHMEYIITLCGKIRVKECGTCIYHCFKIEQHAQFFIIVNYML